MTKQSQRFTYTIRILRFAINDSIRVRLAQQTTTENEMIETKRLSFFTALIDKSLFSLRTHATSHSTMIWLCAQLMWICIPITHFGCVLLVCGWIVSDATATHYCTRNTFYRFSMRRCISHINMLNSNLSWHWQMTSTRPALNLGRSSRTAMIPFIQLIRINIRMNEEYVCRCRYLRLQMQPIHAYIRDRQRPMHGNEKLIRLLFIVRYFSLSGVR